MVSVLFGVVGCCSNLTLNLLPIAPGLASDEPSTGNLPSPVVGLLSLPVFTIPTWGLKSLDNAGALLLGFGAAPACRKRLACCCTAARCFLLPPPTRLPEISVF